MKPVSGALLIPDEDAPPAWWGLGFMVLALLLRLLGHLNDGLWFDEIWTLVDFGRRPWLEVLTEFGSDNNHPLYTQLAWLSLRAFGESAWALRLPAVVFGVMGVGALWLLARRVVPSTVAVTVTLLLALSYHHVWFSQNARGYTGLLFFTLISTYWLLKALADEHPRAWVYHGLLLGLATYVHLTGVFIAVGHLGVALTTSLRRDVSPRVRWTPFAGLALATGFSLVLHSLILPEMIAFFTRPRPGAPAVAGPAEWTSPWWTIRATAASLGLGVAVGLVALGGGALVAAVGALRFWQRDLRWLILFFLPGLAGGAMLIGLGRNLWPRFFFFLAGFMLLVVVVGIDTSARLFSAAVKKPSWGRPLSFLGQAIAVAAFALILPRAYALPKQDYAGAQAWVDAHRTPGDTVVTVGLTRMPYARYYRTDYRPIATAAELQTTTSTQGRLLVMHTLPAYLTSRAPALARRLAGFRELARFPGSVGAGDIVVLTTTVAAD